METETPKAVPKAVVFTHIHFRDGEARALDDQDAADSFIERTAKFFVEYVKCPNVGLVYVYVDVGTQVVFGLAQGPAKGEIQVSLQELAIEQRARGCVKLAVDRAIGKVVSSPPAGFDSAQVPKFQVVGLPHLSTLFSNLVGVDRDLISDLAGPQGQFTYDAPKFIEAVIRVARGSSRAHSANPVLRFDSDVFVNKDGIGEILSAVDRETKDTQHIMHFFSGGYGLFGNPRDVVNDYAVRVHWLVFWDSVSRSWLSDARGDRFLRDLGEIGATQVPTAEPMSTAMKSFIREAPRNGKSMNRASPQVISGAGLYMSLSAIEKLPPFMSFANATIWVDDHLKRRLHEAIKDLSSTSLERVGGQALSRQDRYDDRDSRGNVLRGRGDGIVIGDIEWAQRQYFERLLRGCLLHDLIVRPGGGGGPLAAEVGRSVHTLHGLTQPDKDVLRPQFMLQVNQTARSILALWESVNYGKVTGQVRDAVGRSGTRLLNDWAAGITKSKLDDICGTTVDDALGYLSLVARWPRHVLAMKQLRPIDAYWLFRSVEGSSY